MDKPTQTVKPVGPSRRIASLDGLRAVSIVMVFAGHFLGYGRHATQPAMMRSLAYTGVQVFFVISGFLITMLLLKEQQSTGGINLRSFYWRRTLRIFPAMYTLILIIAALRLVPWRDVLIASTYSTAYFDDSMSWSLGHLWSLSVEEQFYAVWPLALVLAFPWRRQTAWAVMIASPLLRLLYVHVLGWKDVIHYFPTVADSIGAGCLLALYYPVLLKRFAWLSNPLVVTLLAIVSVSIRPLLLRSDDARYLFGGIVPLLIALCIFGAVEGKFSILNNRLAIQLGAMSYSLYLWQQPFSEWQHAHFEILINVACTVAAATVSYYAIEQPFLSYRKKASTHA